MEVLVELIVWIFKVLFGEQEKPADIQPTRRQRPLAGAPSSGDRPKTLEEILQEVRRQAAERQAGGPPTPRSPAAQAAPPPPARPSLSEPLSTSLSEPLSEPRPVKVAPPPVQRPVQRPQPRSQPQQMAPARRAAPATSAPRVSNTTAPADRPSVVIGRLKEQAASAPGAIPGAQNPLALLNAIRSANPAERRHVARQAMVLNEVFGRPLCRRRRGR